MNRILEILKEQGRTQTYLSEKMQKSQNTIYNWCHNLTQPSLTEAQALASLLNIEISNLLVSNEKDRRK
jgi:putative transcriptional regulator